ncbi:MAG: N-acetylneuraminate synthase [Candidatus Doudnabacteria bacterium RIFCSPHIGHO2_02_FULL_48_21]|uniref:N-acetylneuraminate synthase n=1 Tax=Candidatus Doudnabacteria bacterium RIFCSPLOWO2_02_FULL_48_13 TaxID=1817845 RepID=A0A1F5QBP5_9BACT|nr:MAG: N-acetylneuraminate synthase [Candidatus Doudnabacteria bacterium RIFCSPHIGHO2_01_48_18]OGE78726.1 MAG: N-acetylneuraminate synthase [Candidatus Doudnabacteria bacterium RIFCSPHIGHO2_01_FULL_48_180]OGE91404.1 MAG: N-acetylneuraminate synthase [Candidatus Doudnabacteria bacterium RIFCSPHIGHO2_12_FULL_47_25]OGE93901.1 MAG: N-acetylneuraminate synthase [Candidatus Doudnabacteria bacterium RIFCSPHIGHO2_02_FULL_48_21]OGE97880.1 MAG: N-acetylneuraminate synthase [Candidatus Doudnabacteria bac
MSKTVKIGNKLIGDEQPVFVVAEIGINHNGDMEIAKKLIDASVEAGADAVKFQKRTVDVVYTVEELAKPRENPFGPTNGDLKRGLEFGQKDYQEIDRYCKEKGIMWFASCWDEGSVDFIDAFNPPCYKIASASLTDDGLLRHTRSKGKPVILSTGMSTMQEVEHAVEVLGQDNLILMHTNSTYPSDIKELNLLMIKTLKEKYPDVPVGYSGHEIALATSVMSVVLGAAIVERHITLDRAMWGSDHAASMEPKGLQLLVRDIRVWEKAKGDGVKRVFESEIPVKKKLRRK